MECDDEHGSSEIPSVSPVFSRQAHLISVYLVCLACERSALLQPNRSRRVSISPLSLDYSPLLAFPDQAVFFLTPTNPKLKKKIQHAKKVEEVNSAQRSIRLSGVDLVDGTPVLDVKPYVPDYDCPRTSGPDDGSGGKGVEGGVRVAVSFFFLFPRSFCFSGSGRGRARGGVVVGGWRGAGRAPASLFAEVRE